MEMKRWEFLLLLARYYGSERLGESEHLYKAALREAETLLDTVMADTGLTSLLRESKLAAAAGRLVEQEELLNKAILQAKKELGTSDPRLSLLLLRLAECLEAQATAKDMEADKHFMLAGRILRKNAKRMGIVASTGRSRTDR
jgi:hypothetical protein